MKNKPRILLDTNLLISFLLANQSVPGQAALKALESGQLIASIYTLEELMEVLGRAKFDAYISQNDRKEFITYLSRVVEITIPTTHLQICLDPKDNKFPDTAASGNVNHIVTGDNDLLVLNPFMKIKILSPKDFLEMDL